MRPEPTPASATGGPVDQTGAPELLQITQAGVIAGGMQGPADDDTALASGAANHSAPALAPAATAEMAPAPAKLLASDAAIAENSQELPQHVATDPSEPRHAEDSAWPEAASDSDGLPTDPPNLSTLPRLAPHPSGHAPASGHGRPGDGEAGRVAAPEPSADRPAQHPPADRRSAPNAPWHVSPTVTATPSDASAEKGEPGLIPAQPGPHAEATDLPTTTPVHRSLPAGLVHQLAVNISHRPGQSVEVTLTPEELGKVRMSLSAQDGVLTLALTAERSDTLDMLRRHIDQLAQDFRDLGFDRLNFSFTSDQQRNRDGSRGPPLDASPESASPMAATGEPSPRPHQPARLDGLDIRL